MSTPRRMSGNALEDYGPSPPLQLPKPERVEQAKPPAEDRCCERKGDGMSKISDALYPVAIIQDRYNGCYSHGQWLAISQASNWYRDTLTRVSWCLYEGPHGDDMDAMTFWQNPPEWIAAGATPEEAIAKLAAPPKPD
jgi:hypothetical protein